MKKALSVIIAFVIFSFVIGNNFGYNNVVAGTYNLDGIIKELIIPQASPIRQNITSEKKCITIHETANYKTGANAEMHAKWLYEGGDGEIAYHYTVDDKEIYKHLPDNEISFHAGDGEEGVGNTQSIGIELCVNSDSDLEQTRRNAAYLVAKLMVDMMKPLNISTLEKNKEANYGYI